MPVKIQELVIQTKLKPNNSSADGGQSSTPSQQDLRKFERKLRHLCLEAMQNLLQENQER
ncbi:MAG: hypothetical protein BGO68_03025 [Candidatus Amoebophilus sp. 36-38]|nr:MAG: hypothetical protein BGO68_03025 [Candidatus Amoebophilus sp. 36-38]